MALLQISEPGMSPEPHQRRLAVGIDHSTRTGLHTADVDDVRAFGHHPVHRLLGGLVTESGAAVIEGVRRAVDDRHDQCPVTRHRPPTERRAHPTIVPGCRGRWWKAPAAGHRVTVRRVLIHRGHCDRGYLPAATSAGYSG